LVGVPASSIFSMGTYADPTEPPLRMTFRLVFAYPPDVLRDTAATVVWCSTAAFGLPRTRSSATRGTNLGGEVHDLHVGVPYGGRDDHRSVESEQAPLPH